ncbi:MAG: methyl-accepting chemotaxis protein [Oleiphilaceae bacterium]|jgi:methyl-accepting chemotaxis protein
MFKIFRKIFTKILFSCLVIAAIPLGGFVYQIYLNEQAQQENIERKLLTTLDVVGTEVGNWVDINLRNTTFLAGLDVFRKMDAPKMEPLLVAAKESLDWVTLIFAKDMSGEAVSRSDGKKLLNYSDREYFKAVAGGSKFGQQVLIGKLSPVPLHCFAIPIKDSEFGGKNTGIVTQCSTLLEISNYIKSSSFGDTGYGFLVDDKNRLIAIGDNPLALGTGLQDFTGHPALGLTEGVVDTINYEGRDIVFSKKSVGPGWTLIIQQDYSEAYGGIFAAQAQAVVLVAITILSTLFLSFLVSRNISKPIKYLTSIAEYLSTGKLVGDFEGQTRRDEIGELSRAIAKMSKTIESAIRRIRLMKKEQEEKAAA